MPFGKYKGLYLWEIDTGYLLWLLEQPRLREPLLSAVCREVRARNDIETTSAPETNKDKVKRIYRELVFKWHPDRGGNTQATQALNDFYEKLIQG